MTITFSGAVSITGKITAEIEPLPAGPAAEIAVDAVEFDGTNDYLTRGAGYTDAADSDKGSIVIWVKLNTDSGSQLFLNQAEGVHSPLVFNRQGNGTIRLILRDSASDDVLVILSDLTLNIANGWTCIMVSWDTSVAQEAMIYLGDNAATLTVDTQVIGTIDNTMTEHSVGANTIGGAKLNGCLSQVYLNIEDYIDFTVEDNRRKFISAEGKPVDLGSDGSTPTGNIPILFLTGAAASWHTNSGSGGGMTAEDGPLTDCADSPSDVPFQVNAVNFDGTNDYLTRGGGLTGAANDSKGTFSCWVRFTSSSFANIFTGRIGSNVGHVQIAKNGTDKINIVLRTAGNSILISVPTVNAITLNVWNHILISWDFSLGAGNRVQTYINDVDDTDTPGTDNGGVVGYVLDEWQIGAGFSGISPGASKFVGDMAEFWFEDGLWYDLSIEANRRKFIDVSGKPVDLGSDGSGPTESSPIIFLSGNTATWHTNDGTGGGFTSNETLDAASSNPSD